MKLRQRESQEERCAVCRDGPEGLVICRGCSTLLHASCLIDVHGCPTIGCDEIDPLQKASRDGPADPAYVPHPQSWAPIDINNSPYSVEEMRLGGDAQDTDTETITSSNDCWVHSETISAQARADLYDVWGHNIDEISEQCTCKGPRPCYEPDILKWEEDHKLHRALEKAKNRERLTKDTLDENEMVMERFRATRKAAEKKRAALAKATQKELGCNHQFSPHDMRCILCHQSEVKVDEQMRDVGVVAYAKETVMCGSPRCKEPTTRQAVYCVLCYADVACDWAKFPEPKEKKTRQRQPQEDYVHSRVKGVPFMQKWRDEEHTAWLRFTLYLVTISFLIAAFFAFIWA